MDYWRESRGQFHQHFAHNFFRTKVTCVAFLYIHFRFVLFRRKNIEAKAAQKMLVKLTIFVNLVTILRAAFGSYLIYDVFIGEKEIID